MEISRIQDILVTYKIQPLTIAEKFHDFSRKNSVSGQISDHNLADGREPFFRTKSGSMKSNISKGFLKDKEIEKEIENEKEESKIKMEKIQCRVHIVTDSNPGIEKVLIALVCS